ncbi:NAD-dependent protein deacetylase hst2-like isoform X2 [Stylophora pistillata]|uniref:NAD-dependent protein deacetylase hst2-like isoform X2 n=1 Tax=Stylophora pistillata TaxID=50429 RepID=UPI000C0576B2|nr:NAD-dependent protein deacetylase hst2-like isoform X2 [Stylophora pistillata]
MVFMQSTKTQRLPLAIKSPIKSSVRKTSSGSLLSVTPLKLPAKKKTGTFVTSRSDTRLTSSFRKLSITPNPHPPSRSKSTIPRKAKSSHVRGLNSYAVNSVEDIVNLIKEGKCKNIIVMAGAGISTPSGIPDFRTPGTGLYDNLQQYKIPEPTAIFDLDYFWYDPRPFFCLAQSLYPGNYQPNYVHHFVKLLHDKGLLLRMYTQNIDGLERLAEVPATKLVEAHGTFSTASCIRCHKSYDGEQIKKTIMDGDIPKCSSPRCSGVVKPDIVFFGENLPKKFYSYVVDFPKCDLLVIMGTSLEVEPFAGIANSVDRSTPRLLVNREIVGPFSRRSERRSNDVVLQGDIVEGVTKLVNLLGWSDSMDAITNGAKQKWKDYSSTTDPKVSKASEELAKSIGRTTDSKEMVENTSGTSNAQLKNGVDVQRKDSGQFTSTPKNGISNGPTGLNSFGTRTLHSLTNGFTGKGVLYRTSKTALFMNGEGPIRPSAASQRAPLLPFLYTQRKESSEQNKNTDFKIIDPGKDLASAGFGLGRRSVGRVSCFLAGTAGESSSDDDSA